MLIKLVETKNEVFRCVAKRVEETQQTLFSFVIAN